MDYTIKGGNLPVVCINLNKGEAVKCEAGAMSWMDDCIKMETKGGGIGKVFGRLVSGETMMLNTYTAHQDGEIAFASSFPGSIIAREITPGQAVIAQKGAFLASFGDIEMNVFFQKRLGTGVFGGEGFIMQEFKGRGVVFFEIDGHVEEYTLQAGQKKVIDTCHLAMMDASCKMSIERIKGVKNIMFGGEGLFNTTVEGPGKVYLQTMPFDNLASRIIAMIPSSD